MAQHNLGTVISFEFVRTVTKPRFWIGTLSVPVIMAIVFGLIFLSNTTTAPPPRPRRTPSSRSPTWMPPA